LRPLPDRETWWAEAEEGARSAGTAIYYLPECIASLSSQVSLQVLHETRRVLALAPG